MNPSMLPGWFRPLWLISMSDLVPCLVALWSLRSSKSKIWRNMRWMLVGLALDSGVLLILGFFPPTLQTRLEFMVGARIVKSLTVWGFLSYLFGFTNGEKDH